MIDDSSDAGDGLEYNSDGDTYRTEFARSERPSMAVVKAIAAITGRPQDELEPLFYAIDPEALDSLFQPAVEGEHRGDVDVSFTYHGYEVTVHSYGIVDVRPVEETSRIGDESA